VCARSSSAVWEEGKQTYVEPLVVGQVGESVGEGRPSSDSRLRRAIIGRNHLGHVAGICSPLTRWMGSCCRKRVRIVGWLMERLIIDCASGRMDSRGRNRGRRKFAKCPRSHVRRRNVGPTAVPYSCIHTRGAMRKEKHRLSDGERGADGSRQGRVEQCTGYSADWSEQAAGPRPKDLPNWVHYCRPSGMDSLHICLGSWSWG
jgi:hypothetical protein